MGSTRLDRREFLFRAGQCAGASWLGCTLAGSLALADGTSSAPFTREVDHYTPLPGKRIKCFVCPLHCELNDGETCFCRTRTNIGGRLYTRAYENPCLLRVDPIEKLPLNHYRPGSSTLTIATGGCNVRCLYCQNWQHSQKKPDELKTVRLTPREAVALARKRRVDTIAFGYTEPVAFMEYARDIAVLAKRARLRVVAATAAFVDPDPLLDLARYVDAFVVALKGFSEDFYYRVLGIRLAPVLTAIETLATRSRCWLELVNLVVPTYNDDPDQIRAMAAWIHRHAGPDVPVHFERFVPEYRLTNLPRTPVPTLEAACDAARAAGLRYVYTSNIAPHEGCNTICASCGATVIERLGFKILTNSLKRGVCPRCHKRLPGVWA